MTPWKSAAKQVFEAVEGPAYGSTDVRELDLDDCLRRWENMERGNYKAESLQSYGSRLRRAHAAYLAFLANGTTPQLSRRTPRRREARTSRRPPRSSATAERGPAAGAAAPPAADLVDYPFPCSGSGQLAYGASPAHARAHTDAERLAAFVRTLVFEPQGQLAAGTTEQETGSWSDQAAAYTVAAAGLSKGEILRIVHNYIGVEGGYLGDFTYQSHVDFYPMYAELDLNPFDYLQEVRPQERFIVVLEQSPPHLQAKIVHGVVEKYPVGSSPLRTAAARDSLVAMAERLERRGGGAGGGAHLHKRRRDPRDQ